MEMLPTARVLEADLPDWRRMAQALAARFVVPDLAAAARLAGAVADAAPPGHVELRLTDAHVEVRLLSDDAVHIDAEGDEHVVTWVTQADVDEARRISELAAAHGARPDPGAVTEVELALDTTRAAEVAPFWAVLLTGDPASEGRGSLDHDVRDGSGRVLNLWFQEPDVEPVLADGGVPPQRFHLDVWVPPELASERVAAAVAAGGTVVDDSSAPSYTVLSDRDGNRACVCTATP